VLFDQPGDLRSGFQELLHQFVVEDLIATLAVDVAPSLIEVVLHLQVLGREPVVGDPGGTRRDSGGAPDLPGLDNEDSCALLGGAECRHQARTAGPDGRHVYFVGDAVLGHGPDGAAVLSGTASHDALPIRVRSYPSPLGGTAFTDL
jgi:hypothetical protein